MMGCGWESASYSGVYRARRRLGKRASKHEASKDGVGQPVATKRAGGLFFFSFSSCSLLLLHVLFLLFFIIIFAFFYMAVFVALGRGAGVVRRS